MNTNTKTATKRAGFVAALVAAAAIASAPFAGAGVSGAGSSSDANQISNQNAQTRDTTSTGITEIIVTKEFDKSSPSRLTVDKEPLPPGSQSSELG
jgi:hypothetical protein